MPHSPRFAQPLGAVVVSALLAAGCGGSRAPATTTSTPAPPTASRLLVVRSEAAGAVGTTPDAIARWRPAIDQPTREGQCVRRAMPEPGVQALTLPSTNADGSSNTVTVMVDAGGRVVRYSDARGLPRVVITDTSLTPTQRDSAVSAQLGDGPRTIISLDYITGDANATNRDVVPGQPTAIRGSAAQFDTLPAMGPPQARIAAVRAKCAGA